MTVRNNLAFIIFTLEYKYLYPIHAPKTRGMILHPSISRLFNCGVGVRLGHCPVREGFVPVVFTEAFPVESANFDL